MGQIVTIGFNRLADGAHGVIGGAPGAADSLQAGGYAAWKVLHGVADDFQDDDKDNIPALVEYALGTSPSTSDTSALPTTGVTAVGDALFLTISYEKNPILSRVTDRIP